MSIVSAKMKVQRRFLCCSLSSHPLKGVGVPAQVIIASSLSGCYTRLINYPKRQPVNFFMKNSFIIDILGAVLCIGWGVYTNDPWWWGGGIAGLVFSIFWKRIQPKVMGRFLKKTKAPVESAPPDIAALGTNPLAPETPYSNTAAASETPAAAPSAEAAPPEQPHPVFTWPVNPPKDGRLRFY